MAFGNYRDKRLMFCVNKEKILRLSFVLKHFYLLCVLGKFIKIKSIFSKEFIKLNLLVLIFINIIIIQK